MEATGQTVRCWRQAGGTAASAAGGWALYRGAVTGDEVGTKLVDALGALDEVADAMTPDEAVNGIDEASLQVFWKDWPQVSSWAGALWRKLNVDLADAARPLDGSDLDEVGGSG